MSTSGVSDFDATRNQIIREAALLARFVSRGVPITGEMITDFNYTLNSMVKHWTAKGLHVWTESEGILFPQPGQIKYAAGGAAGTDHITASYVQTAVTADEAFGQTVIGLDDTSDIAATNNIGITLDDGTIHWTTVVSKNATTATITLALTDSAAAGNAVFIYAAKIVKPIKVLNVRRYNITGRTETPVSSISRQEWSAIPNKLSAGSMNEVYYDKQLKTGYFNLRGVPAATEELLYFDWHRPIMDFAAAGDNPDLPHEWIQTLQYNLAKLYLPRAVMPQPDKVLIIKMADEFLNDMMGFDREDESIFVQPNMRG